MMIKALSLSGVFGETSPNERALLFFIANRDEDKNLIMGYSDFRVIKQDEVMSGKLVPSMKVSITNYFWMN